LLLDSGAQGRRHEIRHAGISRRRADRLMVPSAAALPGLARTNPVSVCSFDLTDDLEPQLTERSGFLGLLCLSGPGPVERGDEHGDDRDERLDEDGEDSDEAPARRDGASGMEFSTEL